MRKSVRILQVCLWRRIVLDRQQMPRFVLISLGVGNDPSERAHVLAISTETEKNPSLPSEYYEVK